MYKLYGIPGSCSTGIHALLNYLQQEFEFIPKSTVENYETIHPLGSVPVLDDDGTLICEGAAIVLYLLEKHENHMLPTDQMRKSAFVQKLIFNYATMHPAYNRLFFATQNFEGQTRKDAYKAGALAINKLWAAIEKSLEENRFFSGDCVTIIDYLLCIYANWGELFDVTIYHGKRVESMIKEVSQLPDFNRALEAEGVEFVFLRS